MLVSTTRCQDYGHAEFALEVDDSAVPHQHFARVIQTIEGMVAQGSVFAPGETFQIGWMTTQVQRYDEDRLTLFEPDMRSMPIVFVPGVTATLRQMMLQLFLIDSVAVPRHDMDIPNICQSAVACTKLGAATGLILSRDKVLHANDSGWFIGCHDEDHDHNSNANLICVSLYEAFLKQKPIQGWMAFPVGTLVALQDGEPPMVFKDGTKLAILPDSYLGQLIGKQSQ
jgi:hypothetical protein